MKRLRWATHTKNFKILHDLLTNLFPQYQNDESYWDDEPYWDVFEEIEDYFLDLEENHETDNGDKGNIL